MISDSVVVQRHLGWWCIRIAREPKRNALDRATRRALHAALDAARSEARAIVLTGTGGSFCAGLDLRERAADLAAGAPDTAGTEALELNMALRTHPAVTIAAVNGLALGGGVTLVHACDLALAASAASFGCPELTSGGYASMAGPTSRLLLPRKRAAWLLLSGERVDATTAERWGVVNAVLDDAALLPRACALAERIAGYDPAALAETKASLDHGPGDAGPGIWREAMAHGQGVAAAIRAAREA